MNGHGSVRRAPTALIEGAALAFVGLGAAIILLPDRFQETIVWPAGGCLVLGSVLWIFVMRGAERSRDELSSTLGLRERAEQELARSEERFRLAQTIARIGTWDTDLTSMHALWSESLRDLWGVGPDAPASYEAFLDLVHPDDRQHVDAAVARAREADGDFEFEYRVRRPTGEVRWFLCRGRILFDDQEEETRVLGVAMDISDRKLAETDRTQLEEQLRQAQKLQAVGRLASGVAHDFNNLLQAIRGYGELAQIALKRGDDARTEVDEIVSVADRAAGLTGQLLAFSRKQVLRPSILDLKKVVGKMGSLLRMLVGDQIEVELPLGRTDVYVNVDPAQLERVITNLAVNARDAMPTGGRLTLEIERAELGPDHGFDGPAKEFALLAVSDTGGGMDAETAAQIFEPFFTTKEQGTGLGLATAHGIVTQSGGSIWVYSELGEGTTFKVYLPLVEEVQEPGKSQPTRTCGDGLGETVLLVEDDAQLRGIVARMLETRGYRVVRASGGEEALRLAHGDNGPIDLILSDLMMPGLGGRELVDRVRELQPTAPVLYMSGYTDDAAVRRGVLDQSAAFIAKPFSSDELARQARELIDGAGSTAAD
jgi:two-component system, cell cycle sensor histidine kinase and response regulator CckA